MPRKTSKAITKAGQGKNLSAELRESLGKRTKAELIDALVALANEDRRVYRQLDARFKLDGSLEHLVASARQAIADATDFDERGINSNFSYDTLAYTHVKKNLERLVALGELKVAMELSLELMKAGSDQVEMSDEGLMTEEIEECLEVVVKALKKGQLPKAEVVLWCKQMAEKDRVGFIFDSELRALRQQFGS